MPQTPKTCEFETSIDQVKFTTSTNGDRLVLKGFHLDQDNAATLAWLINQDSNCRLEWEVKVKVE